MTDDTIHTDYDVFEDDLFAEDESSHHATIGRWGLVLQFPDGYRTGLAFAEIQGLQGETS